jgi:glyoxylase I family protein
MLPHPAPDPLMLRIVSLHHVSLAVTDIGRARRFYAEVLGLPEIERPQFPFLGAWYAVGDRQLHLIVGEHPTLREGKSIDTRDAHVAIRVASYRDAVEHLRALGYTPDAADEMYRTREQPHA